jgi:hypothetical protein
MKILLNKEYKNIETNLITMKYPSESLYEHIKEKYIIIFNKHKY